MIDMNERELLEVLTKQIREHNKFWRVKSEIPIGSLRADARIDEVDENEVVKSVIAYVEIKDSSADLKELLSGYADALYYCEQSGCHGWLAIPETCVKKVLDSGKKFDPRVQLYNLDSGEIVKLETTEEKMSKSRMKRKMESTYFQGWSEQFTIETTSPIAITKPEYAADGDSVIFNLGPRVRGCLKEVAKTISGSLSDSVKYSIYVEPPTIIIAKKSELGMIRKYVPNARGGASVRELYEVPAPRQLTFTVRSINPRLTKEICENLIRQAGQFAGIGDSHSDGLHGRFFVVSDKGSVTTQE